jgi:hypothetical protein
MRKLGFLFVMMLWLVGCAAHVNVRVSDGSGDYSIYRNGELMCESSEACSVEVSAAKSMYLEAKKDGVVYGSTYIQREKKEIDHSRDDERNWYTGKTRKEEREESEQSLKSLSLLFIAVFPVFIFMMDSGSYPNEVVIPLDKPASSVENYPWEQPINYDRHQ